MTDRITLMVASGFEVAGVAAIVFVSVAATIRFARRALASPDWIALLPPFRADLGRGVLLGLELLVAADIVGTVAVEPGFASLGVLALVIVIRTFLSISFGVEIDGRWPWQRLDAERGAAPSDAGSRQRPGIILNANEQHQSITGDFP